MAKTAEQLAAENAELVAKLAAAEARIKAKPDALQAEDLTNIKYSLDGKILTLVIDLAQEHGLTASGKGTAIASTHGNRMILGCKVGVNVYRPVAR